MTCAKRSREEREQGENVRPQLVELHFKFAIPFGALIFGLVGLPLGVQRTQSGRSWGFILCAVIFLLYYVFYCLGKDLGVSGDYIPLLGGMVPQHPLRQFGGISLGKDRTRVSFAYYFLG